LSNRKEKEREGGKKGGMDSYFALKPDKSTLRP